ncbi:hypothetical protein [Terriglobus aquaticus]|uniref:Uncharacterized protein n=1 Tax=Terriglobus aquaticus TaxID=940139 RepID=A0ABW9KKV9_9BACT|nr:hypothetical protein [Terriglobus aquaticus]
MPLVKDETSLGAWTESELVDSAATFQPIGMDSDMPPEIRFKGGVAKLVQLRHLRGFSEEGLSVFLLARSGEVSLENFSRVPMLRNGQNQLGGRVWIVNPTVNSGWSREHQTNDDDELFRFVSEGLALGTLPALIFDPRCRELRFYPHGLNAIDHVELAPLTSNVNVDEVFRHIDALYQKELITPEAQSAVGKLWEDATRWRPVKLAEQTVQFYIKVGLNRAFPLCNVRQERTQVTGRVDLLIEEYTGVGPSSLINHMVIELKVLRSFSAGGKAIPPKDMVDWVTKGVEQASAYRNEAHALTSALCCFDMRKSDTGAACFKHILSKAAALGVNLRRWYLYSSSAELRRALGASA